MSILHITNGDSTRMGLEHSSVPGTFSSWSDILHEGPTPWGVSPDEWRRVRVEYLASLGGGDRDAVAIAAKYRREDAALARWRDHEEVVFWFEHDLYDQLLLIRHLCWLGAHGAKGAAGADGAGATGATRVSLVCGGTYLGLLKPDAFPPLFAARTAITDAQIRIGTRAWQACCAADPTGLLPFAAAAQTAGEDAEYAELPYLPGAIQRHLEEFPSATNGLARSEAQVLQVLSEGMRTPEEAFIEASRLEERIFMGDTSFWAIVRRLTQGSRPLVACEVHPRPGRLPDGTLALTSDGRAVLSGRADQITLNGVDRWLGGVHLTPASCWTWSGSTLLRRRLL
jgi:hypothetical protein